MHLHEYDPETRKPSSRFKIAGSLLGQEPITKYQRPGMNFINLTYLLFYKQIPVFSKEVPS